MKKILHISKYYYPFRGGTEQIAQDCVDALKEGYEQEVICFNHLENDSEDMIDDITVIRCGCFAKIASQSLSISYGKKLRTEIERFKPNIIIFHYPNPFVARYLLKFIPSNVRLVIYWHLDIVKQKLLGKFFEKQNRRLIERADLLIATSPNYIEGSKFLSGAMSKCVVVPNCIDENRMEITEDIISKSKEIKDRYANKIICLSVGRHTEYKGFKYLIEASKSLDDRFVIFIAGKGELTKDLKKQAEGNDKINFLGAIPDNDLKAYLNAMDIFCFPSITKNEAFGLALAEGMYFGKPAVTFTIPGSGVNYVSCNGLTGIEVPNRDSLMYAHALETLANDCELRKLYGNNGKKRVESMFLKAQYSLNIVKVIGNL